MLAERRQEPCPRQELARLGGFAPRLRFSITQNLTRSCSEVYDRLLCGRPHRTMEASTCTPTLRRRGCRWTPTTPSTTRASCSTRRAVRALQLWACCMVRKCKHLRERLSNWWQSPAACCRAVHRRLILFVLPLSKLCDGALLSTSLPRPHSKTGVDMLPMVE